MSRPFLLVLTGPTGAGKTALSLALYEKYGWPIISADSRQVYRYMDIGTNKVSQAVRAQVPHFLIDVVWPNEPFSVGRFVEMAEAILAGQEGVWQVVGGTGFYIEALLWGLDPVPAVPAEIRAQVEAYYGAHGLEGLVVWLKSLDPLAAARIDLRNPRRVQRALEVYLATGRPWVSFWQGKAQIPRYPHLTVVLSRPRLKLYQVINERTAWQVAAGWLAETRFLLEKGYRPTDPGLVTLGYKECLQVIEGRLAEEALTERIAQANRHYARRQLTWARHHRYDLWLEGYALRDQVSLLEKRQTDFEASK
jgi:tRNA dimethylallyltransferase